MGRIFTAIWICLIACSMHSDAATIYVGRDDTTGIASSGDLIYVGTIQNAIDVASDGYTIIIRDGIYTGPGNSNITFRGKALHVRSQNGPENCVIQVSGSEESPRRGFIFWSGESPASILEGITITGGFADTGGAISIEDSSPTIIGCRIIDNTATKGGGIAVSEGMPLIRNNVIADNSADGEGASGGGIFLHNSSATILNNTFAGNASSWGDVPRHGKSYNIKILSDKVDDVSSLEAIINSIIEHGMTDEEKAIAIWRHVSAFRHQDHPPYEYLGTGRHVHDVVKTFNVYGYNQCSCAAANVVSLARAAGMEARGYSITLHGVAEIFYDGEWRMFDGSLVCYFRKADGSVAGIKYIQDRVADWYAANPEYAADPNLLKTLPLEQAPPIFARSPFLDENGVLPANVHNLYALMIQYNGETDLESEFGHSEGHRMHFTLRQNERLTRNWFNNGRHVNMYDAPTPFIINTATGTGGLRYTPEYGDIAPGRIGSGELIYMPNFEDGSWRAGAESKENIVCKAEDGLSPALRLHDPQQAGTVIFKMQSPYVCFAGHIAGRLAGGTLDVSLSTNHQIDFHHVATIDTPGDFQIDTSARILRRYTYYVKLTLTGADAGLDSIELFSEIQASQRSLPALTSGSNTITVTTGPAISTMTFEPTVFQTSNFNETWVDFQGQLEGRIGNISWGIWIEEIYTIPLDERRGYLVFPVQAPGPIQAIRGGGFYRARNADAGVKLEASFDNGATWHTVSDAPGPYAGFSKFGTLDAIPPDTTEALVRYHLYGTAPVGIFSMRFDVDYHDGPESRDPIKITYQWKQDGELRTHEQIVRELHTSYDIFVEGDPVMHAITVEPVDMAPKGGSIYASASSLVVKNSIFVDNIADVGSDIHIVGLDSPALLDISFSAISGLRNITAEGPLASLIIEEGILTQRPHFANPSQRDFRLKSRAGRFDATNSCTWVTDDLHSPGISAGHPDSDNSLEPAPNGQRINLGAYGNTAQASMDLWFIHGDATQTCTLNILDIIFIRNRLGQPVETCDQYRADVNRDGVIDFHDLLFVRNLLGKTCD